MSPLTSQSNLGSNLIRVKLICIGFHLERKFNLGYVEMFRTIFFHGASWMHRYEFQALRSSPNSLSIPPRLDQNVFNFMVVLKNVYKKYRVDTCCRDLGSPNIKSQIGVIFSEPLWPGFRRLTSPACHDEAEIQNLLLKTDLFYPDNETMLAWDTHNQLVKYALI